MAPEMITAETSPATDVWAFGVIVAELITKRRAYEGIPALVILHKVSNNELRPALPEESEMNAAKLPLTLRDVAQQCLQTQPDARPTFKNICDQLK